METAIKERLLDDTGSTDAEAAVGNEQESIGDEISLRTCDSELFESVTGIQDLIPEFMDAGTLSDALERKGLITRTERNSIHNKRSCFSQSRKLMRVLRCGIAQQPFLDTLEETGQRHLANYIRNRGVWSAEFGDEWPLSLQVLRRLDEIQRDAIGKLVVNDVLLARLLERQWLSTYQYESLVNTTTTTERLKRLVEITKQKNVAQFRTFLSCLNATGQTEALLVLDSGNDQTCLFANAPEPRLHGLGPSPEVWTKIMDYNEDIPSGHSDLDLRSDPLSRADESGDENPTENPPTPSPANKRHIDDLIADVMQPLLLLSIGLIRQLSLTTPRSQQEAELEAVKLVASVCSQWLKTIRQNLTRPFIKRQLRQLLRRFPQLMASVPSECRKIRGVALLDRKLYVVGRRSNVVEVFSCVPPFKKLHKIPVPSLKWPRDMVACAEQNCLYVTDNCPETNCVWRVGVGPGSHHAVAEWIRVPRDSYEPWMISGHSSRLAVVPWIGKQIYVYGDRGELLQVTHLPGYYDARHALETDDGTFVVADIEGPKRNVTQEDRVTKVTAGGQETHFYGTERGNGPGQLSDPYHLALDSDGRVIVADHDNDRVVLLNSDLTYSRQLIRTSSGRDCPQFAEPRRLCYDRKSGLLAVGLQGGHVNVYGWKH